MNEAIKAADPASWERHLRKRGEAPADVEGPPVAEEDPVLPPAIEEARAEEDAGWDAVWCSDHEDPADPGEEGAGAGPFC